MSKYVTLNQQKKELTVRDLVSTNSVIFEYFDKLPEGERDEKLQKAIYIGVLALMEDRISAFLSKTSNELGTELESLKMIFDLKKESFYTTNIKGFLAEDDITDILNLYFKDGARNWIDVAEAKGSHEGVLPKNKSGDIVCLVNADENKKIVIEVKYDKSLTLGDIADRDVFTKKFDTAWSQLIEAKVNRDAKAAIIVFDVALLNSSINKFTDSVRFIDGIGFVAIVDSQRNDYSSLFIAYNLARDIVLNAKKIEFDDKTLSMIVKRILKDIEIFFSIKSLVESNIKNNEDILLKLEKVLLCMEFNQKYLEEFLKNGKLNDKDLLDFYSGEEIKAKFSLVEKKILPK